MAANSVQLKPESVQVQPKRLAQEARTAAKQQSKSAWTAKMPEPCELSSRRGESSILRVVRAPKIDPRSAKLHLRCGLEGQVAPKRRQVALGSQFEEPIGVQKTPSCAWKAAQKEL